jgi:hypothetical protein
VTLHVAAGGINRGVTLTRCWDLTAADWIAAGDWPWQQVVEFGPPGFPAYARLRFLPDPTYAGQSENDVDVDEYAPSETTRLAAVLEVLARHTRTPGDCYYCLWDGWGEPLHDFSGRLRTLDRPMDPTAVPAVDPSFSPPRRGPMVVLPNRAYLLFRGTVAELGDRDPAEGWPGQPGTDMVDPAFIWPADHAWCIANDVDPHWAGIGADTAAIDQLVADPRLDVVPADPHTDQPRYR